MGKLMVWLYRTKEYRRIKRKKETKKIIKYITYKDLDQMGRSRQEYRGDVKESLTHILMVFSRKQMM